jgi:hypothetical protein
LNVGGCPLFPISAFPFSAFPLFEKRPLHSVKIVRTVSGALSHREALKVARDWAPLLGLSVAEFMKLRKNE